MKSINVEPTAEIMERMATLMEDAAKEIRLQASKMRKDGDPTRVADTLQTATNLYGNLRLDLLATRPIREFMKD